MWFPSLCLSLSFFSHPMHLPVFVVCCSASPAAAHSESCRCAFGVEAPPQTLTARSTQHAARNAHHATPCPASRASLVANCCNRRERKINEGVAIFVIFLPPARSLGLAALDHTTSVCTGNFHFHLPTTPSLLGRIIGIS